jgi:signal transduction histidine kinase
MATISVQSGAAQHVLEQRPDAARTALAAIREASAGVLDELAVILRLLRDEEDPGRAPTPDLSHVEQLVATSRDAGLQITLSVKGPTADVPAAISTAAYRIVQESLTNVLKHASSSRARVTIAAQPGGGLLVEIGDDGTGSDANGSTGGGVGIQGMRERAESSGGSFRAGPAGTGGFTVRTEWAAR